MRRTGKLYTLTLVSAVLAIYSSIHIAMWNENSSQWHLWVDIVPQGFGMASLITSTLIVRILTRTLLRRKAHAPQAVIACVSKADVAVATGSKSDALLITQADQFPSHVSLPHHRTSAWGQPKRNLTSKHSLVEATTTYSWAECRGGNSLPISVVGQR